MSTVRSESVHFTITGEFMTEHYRNLVREGSWRMAVEHLQDAFTTDMDMQMVTDILSGKKQLVGENTVNLADDDKHLDPEWVKNQYFTYFYSVLFIDRKPYRVYGHVDYLCYDDMLAARELRDYQGYDLDEFNQLRALTYAKNPSTDKALFNDDDGWYLAEPVEKDFPIWLRKEDIEKLSGKKAYTNFRGLMKLDEGEIDAIAEEKRRPKPSFLGSMDPELMSVASARLDAFMENTSKVDEAYDKLDSLREKISKAADEKGGWLELHDEKNNRSYTLPKNAFYRWCLSNSSAWESIDWTPVSPQGMKMVGDDPNHSDWWMFTGHDMEDGYNDEYMAFFSEQRFRIHRELTGHEFTTLLRGTLPGGKVKRIARHVDTPEKIDMINKGDLVIIPTASPDFEAVAHKCADLGAVLMTEVGGKLCHLATVGREFGLTLVMLPDARTLLPMGCKVQIDLEKGSLEAQDMGAEEALKLKMSGLMYR